MMHKVTTCCKMKTWQCDKILAELLRCLTDYEVLLLYGSEVQGRRFNSRRDGHVPMEVEWMNTGLDRFNVLFFNHLADFVCQVRVSARSSWKKAAVLATLVYAYGGRNHPAAQFTNPLRSAHLLCDRAI